MTIDGRPRNRFQPLYLKKATECLQKSSIIICTGCSIWKMKGCSSETGNFWPQIDKAKMRLRPKKCDHIKWNWNKLPLPFKHILVTPIHIGSKMPKMQRFSTTAFYFCNILNGTPCIPRWPICNLSKSCQNILGENVPPLRTLVNVILLSVSVCLIWKKFRKKVTDGRFIPHFTKKRKRILIHSWFHTVEIQEIVCNQKKVVCFVFLKLFFGATE